MSTFLHLPLDATRYESASVLVLPMPYEGTVSYGRGAADGPRAILEASQQLELYDQEFDRECALDYGIHTLPPLDPDLNGPERTVDRIEARVAELAATGKLLVGLGGEHTVSVGFGRGLNRAVGESTVVQIDAHADLRDEYQGTRYSHGCVMRRLSEIAPIIEIGIRSLSHEEAGYIRRHGDRVRVYFSNDVHSAFARTLREVGDAVEGRKVYLTIDVDGLDPSLMPATGTPEPEGLTWRQTLDIIRTVTAKGRVIAFDMVELAPIPGLHGPDFIAAKLAYKTMNIVMEKIRKDRVF